MKEILLRSKKYPGLVTVVDNEEYEILITYSWRPQWNKDIKTFYVITGKNPVILMHRFILEAKRGEYVDHKDHNTLNNVKSNLRICSSSQNGANQLSVKGKTSTYKGVYFQKEDRYHKNPWAAQIKVEGKHIHLGTFSDEKEAASAYNSAAKVYFGEFALVNTL